MVVGRIHVLPPPPRRHRGSSKTLKITKKNINEPKNKQSLIKTSGPVFLESSTWQPMLFDDVVEEEYPAEETHLFYTLTPLLYIFGTYPLARVIANHLLKISSGSYFFNSWSLG